MAAADISHLKVGDDLWNGSTNYTILEFIGEGTFGKVAKCRVGLTSELVAVKIFKDRESAQDANHERSILSRLNEMNPDNMNVIKFYGSFEYFGWTCLVFELLDIDLFHWGQRMSVNQIRPIAKQMLVALKSLKDLRVIHGDIKPDNIMLVNSEKNPYRVKLIDFGNALSPFFVKLGMRIQALGYRAPEIILGLPFTEAIDMWALGCSLASLFLRSYLFLGRCEYHMIKSMVEILGMPLDHKLRAGVYSKRFFSFEENESGSRWRLLTPEEFSVIHGDKPKKRPNSRHHFTSLDDLLSLSVNPISEEDAEEMKDKKVFIDFLKKALHLDAEKRITPEEALRHPFITMSHLGQDPDSSDYLTKAQAHMSVPSINDASGHEDNAKAQRSPTPFQCGSPETHVSEDDWVLFTPGQMEEIERCLNFYRHSTEDDSTIQPNQEQCPHHCDELLASVPSVEVIVVEKVHRPKRFSGMLGRVRKFFSRIRTTISNCFCSSRME